jgi:hypothetical protein
LIDGDAGGALLGVDPAGRSIEGGTLFGLEVVDALVGDTGPLDLGFALDLEEV